jgi:hypothetical protein
MSAAENQAKLQAAYAEWDSTKGANTKVWLDLASDHLKIHSLGADTAALQFAQPRGGEILVGFLEKLLETWEMNYVTPHTFVADGDHVAMFGTASWKYRANGNTVTTPLAHLWRFEDGKVVDFQELFDSAAIVSATT